MAERVIEQWRPVVGYEGAYEVSDLGRVRSVDRTSTVIRGRQTMRVFRRGVMRRPRDGGNGYLLVNLSRRNSVKMLLVHRLVAEAFLGPCPEGLQVAHNNGRRDDNRAANLRYATPSENQHDRIEHGTDLRGAKVFGAKLTEDAVREIRAIAGRTLELATLYGTSRTTIKNVRRGRTWAHV